MEKSSVLVAVFAWIFSQLGGSVSRAAIPEPAFYSGRIVTWPAHRDGFSRHLHVRQGSVTKCHWTVCAAVVRALPSCGHSGTLLHDRLASCSRGLGFSWYFIRIQTRPVELP